MGAYWLSSWMHSFGFWHCKTLDISHIKIITALCKAKLFWVTGGSSWDLVKAALRVKTFGLAVVFPQLFDGAGVRVACPFPVACPRLCWGCGAGSEPASAAATRAAAGTPRGKPPAATLPAGRRSWGLWAPRPLLRQPGGQEMRGKVDAQKGFKTQINKAPALQRAPAYLCVTREFQLALLFFTEGQVKLWQQLLVTSKRQNAE